MPAATGLGDIPRAILVSLSGLQTLSPLPVTSLTLSACPWELLMGQVPVHPVPTVSSCHQHTLCAWPVPPAHGLPVGTPRCQFTLVAPSRQRVTDCIPGTLEKPKQKSCGFHSGLCLSGTHHLAFYSHPKSHFNYTSGRDHFRELLFGTKC